MSRPTLSLVVPIYNEEEVLPILDERLQAFVAKLAMDLEVIFVNDGSNDRSMDNLRALAARDARYRVLSLSKNFGQESAITAGIDYARGAGVVVMDADLEHPPEVILEMVDKWREGFDVVYGQPLHRADESVVKRWFYRAFRAMVPVDAPLDAGDFCLMSRQVVVALRSLRERHRLVRGIVAWIGFKQTSVLYDRPGRAAGQTKYPLRKMVGFAVDGITSFSVLPLRFATYLGMFASLTSILYALFTMAARVFVPSSIPGFTAPVVLVTLLASVQLFMIGIIGEYIGRIYDEVKKRPNYVVAEWLNLPAARDTDEFDVTDRPPPAPVRAEAPNHSPSPSAPPLPVRASIPPSLPRAGSLPAPPPLVRPSGPPPGAALTASPKPPHVDTGSSSKSVPPPGVLVSPSVHVPQPPQLVTVPIPTIPKPPEDPK